MNNKDLKLGFIGQGYVGKNYADDFESRGFSVGVNKIHDWVIKYKQNFILDGTLSNYEQAERNIEISIRKGRKVSIFFIYQDPVTAWEFTKRREEEEGRRIEKEDFVNHFFEAQETVHRLKREFGKGITIFLVEKDFKHQIVQFKRNIEEIDQHVKSTYTDKKTLLEVLL